MCVTVEVQVTSSAPPGALSSAASDVLTKAAQVPPVVPVSLTPLIVSDTAESLWIVVVKVKTPPGSSCAAGVLRVTETAAGMR